FSLLFFFSSRRRHTRFSRDWSSDVCSSDLREERSSTVCLLSKKACVATEHRIRRLHETWCWSRLQHPSEFRQRAGLCRLGRDCRSEERRVGKEWRCGGTACDTEGKGCGISK